ncbi:MAG: glycosyltransferase family 2 protein [Acidobacteriota bacterium]
MRTECLPLVSVVVPCYQSRNTLASTLEAVLQQQTNFAFEMIVVESSGDGTGQWVSSKYPDVRVIEPGNRLLPGSARNVGAQQSRGEYLAFVDADAAPESEWLERLLAVLEQSEQIKLAGGAIENASHQSAAARILYWIEFSEFLPGLASGFRDHLSSSNLMVRRHDFLEAGGFDDVFGMAEDLIFSRHFRGAIYFEGSARIFHGHRASWNSVFHHLRQLGYWSGRYRSKFPAGGAWLRHVPLLAMGLPFWRVAQILRRIFKSNSKEGLLALLWLPGLLLGVFVWAGGFYRGLRY